jgi:hypothetical protein
MALPIRIGDYNITPKPNPKAENTALTQIKDRLGSAAGVYATMDTTAKALAWGSEVASLAEGEGISSFLGEQGKTFKQIAGGTIVAYTAWTALDFHDAVSLVAEKDGSDGRLQDAVKKFFTFLTSACYAILLFIPGVSLIANLAAVSDLTDDVIDIKQGAEKWTLADELQQSQDPNMNEVLSGQLAAQKKQTLFGMIKSVLSAVGGIFAVIGIFFRDLLVPKIVVLTIKFAAGIFRGITHYNKENMSHHVTIERRIDPQPVAPPAPGLLVAAAG